MFSLSERFSLVTVSNLQIRVGARVLLDEVSFRINKGDRVGLVGRNGAGKTTLTKILAGEGIPTSGEVQIKGSVGYLPQDPKETQIGVLAFSRILSARNLDTIVTKMRTAEQNMGSSDANVHDKAMRSYARLESEFLANGGYAAEAQAHSIANNLGLAENILQQTLDTLSGGQRRRVELARILFSDAEMMLLDEPTNHLDADSIVWLREFLKSYAGGLIVISHDVQLLEDCVNKVFHLDANRGEIDIYNMGWKRYLVQRETDEKRRKRELLNAQKKATTLVDQANKMKARASGASAAQSMLKRAQRLLNDIDDVRVVDKVAALRFPTPAACGKVPLFAKGLSKSYGSLEIFVDVNLAIDRGSKVVILGLNGAGKTTLLKMLAGVERADTGEVVAGHGLKIGYYAQEHETLDKERTVLANMRSAAPDLNDAQIRQVLGSFLFSGDDVNKFVKVLSGGEKTRLALATLVVSQANVLLLDEPTNNLDPASRKEILAALASYEGAVVLVSHDEGAVASLNPQRVMLLPDGVEDFWNQDYADLISLA